MLSGSMFAGSPLAAWSTDRFTAEFAAAPA
jgi:hypothetical protein